MENLFHKTFFMKRNSSFSIFFLAIFLLSLSNTMAGTFSGSSSVTNKKNKVIIINAKSALNDLQQPSEPVSNPEEPVKKPHLLKTEELAHIHHFHKERVKKEKYHHQAAYSAAKLILILCHISLLVVAYLHLCH
jgi:hypothetical protein